MIQRKWLLRLMSAVCIWAAACSLMEWAPGFAVPAAIAEEDERNQLEISITAKPAELVAPGDVMLIFSIRNISDDDAQNVYLSSADGLLYEPLGQLSAGQQQSFNRQHTVTQEELDDGKVSYIISHDDPSDSHSKVNYTVQAQIRRSDVRPEVEFTRRFSSLSVEKNSQLTVTYRIRNTGNVTLTNLRVQDSLGDYTGRIDRLEAGESRSLISRAVIDEPVSSDAELDYNAEGLDDVLFTQPLAAQEITIAEAAWEVELIAAHSVFNANHADVLLTLKNTGSAGIRDIRITDESYGGVIADSLTLPAGEQIEISHRYPLRGEMQFSWRISGVSETGRQLQLYAHSQPISEITGQAEDLMLTASADTPRIRRSGSVNIALRIDNPGGMDIRDIALSEAQQGLLHSFAVIPAGGSVEKSFRFDVKESTTYDFSISYTGANGDAISTRALPVEISIAPDGVLPEGAKSSLIEFTGTSIKIGGSSIFAALLISGLVVLLVLIVLLVIASRRARIEKQLRIAQEKQRRREEMGKTNRFTPVRSTNTKTKGR